MAKPLKNLRLKLLALFSAVVLWFVVITVENTVYSFPEEILVEATNLSTNLSLAGDLPEVRLYLRVDKEELKTITKNDFEVFVDLQDAEAGEQKFPIEATAIASQIKILKIEPSEVTLKLSPTSEKDVEVEVKVDGNPAKGYELKEVTADGETVKISGAQSIIDTIESVKAELLLDGTEKADLNQSVMLSFHEEDDVPEGAVQVVPEQIVVSAVIVSELKQKDVSVGAGFSKASDRVAWESRITLNPESISIQGDDEVLESISSLETKPFEISALNRNGSIEVEVALPEGVSLSDPGQKIILELIESEPPEEEEPEEDSETDSNEPTI